MSEAKEAKSEAKEEKKVFEKRNYRRGRAWTFTKNNYEEKDEEKVKWIQTQGARYIVYGRETAPTTGTKHLQGYVYFTNAKSFNKVKELLPNGSHIEKAKGTMTENYEYCSKDGDIYEFGEKSEYGDAREKRDREEMWENALEMAKKGKFEEIDASIQIRYYSQLRAIHAEAMQGTKKESLPGPCGVWFYGVSGAGKSYTARKEFGEPPETYIKNCNRWWDSYTGQDNVIIDDLDPEHAKHLTYYIKIWADRYAFSAEIKHSHAFIRPKKLIITSNYSIEECWPGDKNKADREAIERRFIDIRYFPKKYEEEKKDDNNNNVGFYDDLNN